MKRTDWILAAGLGLALVIGPAAGASAQQTTTPPASESKSDPTPSSPSSSTPSSSSSSPTQVERPAGPSGSIDTRIESRTERTERTDRVGDAAPGGGDSRILGMDPTLAMIVGAAVLVLIVIALVAMARRGETEHRV